MKLGLLFGLGFFAVGCASTSSVPIGTTPHAPLPAGTPVAVYSHEADVKCPYEAIALLHRSDPGKYRVLSLQDSLSFLQDEARHDGANGIIIDYSAPIQSGALSRGIDVHAHAIITNCPVE